jgi:two-component system alkaline phosphatase synthesis response regulator PhoP
MGGDLLHIVLPDLTINRETYLVHYKGVEFNFRRKEFELLFMLASKPGRVFSRHEIFSQVWKKLPIRANTRTIDVHIRKLRMKLDEVLIVTIRGVGYKLSVKSGY